MSHKHIYLEYSISFAFQVFYAADMCLQADKTLCTVLYLIKGQKVDMGKGVVMMPLDITFHNEPMPAGHFRVTLSSVKSGHEDLPPLVRLGGEDNETPPRLGNYKGWVLLWLKNLLHLEPAESTPITTHQQAGRNTTKMYSSIGLPMPGAAGIGLPARSVLISSSVVVA